MYTYVKITAHAWNYYVATYLNILCAVSGKFMVCAGMNLTLQPMACTNHKLPTSIDRESAELPP